MKYGDIHINVKIDGEKASKDIVLLHGWGQNIAMMEPVGKRLHGLGRVIMIDFPGFGQSDEPPRSWGVDDYVLMLRKILSDLDCDNPIIIGHSFGCRVAIKYALDYKVEKLILTGAAGIKPLLSLKTRGRIKVYKVLKKFAILFKSKKLEESLKKRFGSADYRNSSSVMRATLVKVVNEDLSEHLSKIDIPTILFWGKDDEATPLFDGKKMEQLMKDAALIEVSGTHYAYLENLNYFVIIIKEFIG